MDSSKEFPINSVQYNDIGVIGHQSCSSASSSSSPLPSFGHAINSYPASNASIKQEEQCPRVSSSMSSDFGSKLTVSVRPERFAERRIKSGEEMDDVALEIDDQELSPSSSNLPKHQHSANRDVTPGEVAADEDDAARILAAFFAPPNSFGHDPMDESMPKSEEMQQNSYQIHTKRKASGSTSNSSSNESNSQNESSSSKKRPRVQGPADQADALVPMPHSSHSQSGSSSPASLEEASSMSQHNDRSAAQASGPSSPSSAPSFQQRFFSANHNGITDEQYAAAQCATSIIHISSVDSAQKKLKKKPKKKPKKKGKYDGESEGDEQDEDDAHGPENGNEDEEGASRESADSGEGSGGPKSEAVTSFVLRTKNLKKVVKIKIKPAAAPSSAASGSAASNGSSGNDSNSSNGSSGSNSAERSSPASSGEDSENSDEQAEAGAMGRDQDGQEENDDLYEHRRNKKKKTNGGSSVAASSYSASASVSNSDDKKSRRPPKGVSTPEATVLDKGFAIPKMLKDKRDQSLQRYRDKRDRRNYAKQVRYECRKRIASTRVRSQGRFARKGESEAVSTVQ